MSMESDRMASLEAEVERLNGSVEFCHDWYAVRWKRLHQLLKDEAAPAVFDRACAVMANGTADSTEPPQYAQLLNQKEQDVERLRADAERYRFALEYAAEVCRNTIPDQLEKYLRDAARAAGGEHGL